MSINNLSKKCISKSCYLCCKKLYLTPELKIKRDIVNKILLRNKINDCDQPEYKLENIINDINNSLSPLGYAFLLSAKGYYVAHGLFKDLNIFGPYNQVLNYSYGVNNANNIANQINSEYGVGVTGEIIYNGMVSILGDSTTCPSISTYNWINNETKTVYLKRIKIGPEVYVILA